jgi:hypothetical protein
MKSSLSGPNSESSLASADSAEINNKTRSHRETTWKFRRKSRRKRALRPCIHTVSLQTPERWSKGKNIEQNFSNSQNLLLGEEKISKKMSNDQGRNKRKVVLYDADETPKRRVVAKKSNLADRLGAAHQDGDSRSSPDIVVLRTMKHKIDQLGIDLLPSDSVGPPGCTLNTSTTQSRWKAIMRTRRLGLFKRIIFVCDLTDDVLRHPRFPEIYGDPLTRFLPDRKFFFDQPFDPLNFVLIEVNDIRRHEYLKRTYNRLSMLGDQSRISTIMSVCHPHLYAKMIAINPRFDAAPQASVDLKVVREIFLEFDRASQCKHFSEIKLGLPGRTKLLEEFNRRPLIRRESNLTDDQVALLPGVGPERVVEIEKVVNVVEQVYVQVAPKGMKRMAQDMLNLAGLVPRLAKEMKTLADSIPEEGEMEVDDEEMDREMGPDADADELEEGSQDEEADAPPKAAYDNVEDNLPVTPHALRDLKTKSKTIGVEEEDEDSFDNFDVVASTSRGYSFERKAATAGKKTCYLRLGQPIRSKRPPPTYDPQVLNDNATGIPMEGVDCPDFREGRLVYARDSMARQSQSKRCTNWRCLAKDPVHFREDGVDPTTLPYVIRRAIDVAESLGLDQGRFFIKEN